MDLDMDKVGAFAQQVAGALTGAATTAMVVLGDELGLYRALAGAGSVTPAELATQTGTHERYVREWLAQQAAAGFISYDAGAGTFTLPPQPAAGPASASYRTSLVSDWIPALDGAADRLRAGARVADIGCGHGAAVILMAREYPESQFTGYDSHPPSIEVARIRAADAGVADRVRFDIADASRYPAGGYDLVCFFDVLHDLGDPVGAAAHARAALAPGGTLML